MFPGELLAATDIDPNCPGQVIGRTEVKRREIYMKKLEFQFHDSYPALVQLVSQCLDNDPQMRSSSEDLLERLYAVKVVVDKMYGKMGKELNISNVLVMKEMKIQAKKIEELQVSFSEMKCLFFLQKGYMDINLIFFFQICLSIVNCKCAQIL